MDKQQLTARVLANSQPAAPQVIGLIALILGAAIAAAVEWIVDRCLDDHFGEIGDPSPHAQRKLWRLSRWAVRRAAHDHRLQAEADGIDLGEHIGPLTEQSYDGFLKTGRELAGSAELEGMRKVSVGQGAGLPEGA